MDLERNMRILMVAACPLPWPRGTPIRIHRMAEALSLRGHHVDVATYPLGNESIELPYQLHRIAGPGTSMNPEPGPSLKKLLYLDPLLVRRVATLLKTQSFDVIHAHHYEGLIVSMCARRLTKHVPVVFDAHTLLGTELPYYRLPLPRSLIASLGRWLDRRIPRQADHIIAVTNQMKTWFSSTAAIPADHISVIANGVEHQHFANTASAHARTAEAPRIAYAGNFADYQGVDLLLRSFAQIRGEVGDAQLVLLSDSEFHDLDRSLDALGLKDSVFLVRTDYARLPSQLAESNVLVNPRTSCDGIPQKLLNYMASGRPIVSFAGSAAILEHERTALVVPDSDIEAFAQAVLLLLHEPEFGRVLAEAAREQVVAEHSWNQVAEKVELVYKHRLGIHT